MTEELTADLTLKKIENKAKEKDVKKRKSG